MGAPTLATSADQRHPAAVYGVLSLIVWSQIYIPEVNTVLMIGCLVLGSVSGLRARSAARTVSP